MSERIMERSLSFHSNDSVSSIMRVKTHLDSLKSSFREENCQDSSNREVSIHSDCSKLSSDATASSVKFDVISIREYDLTIGDNPSCTAGAPLSLDWNYTEYNQIFGVDDYENMRGQRRVSAQMRMPTSFRHELLMQEWDFSLASIVRASNDIDIVRKQRMETCIKEQKNVRVDDGLKKSKESIRKLFGLSKRRSKSSTCNENI